MKMKHLLLLGTMALTLTACSKAAPPTEETANAESEATVTEAVEETVSETEEEESSEEEATTAETADSVDMEAEPTQTKSSHNASSLSNPVTVSFEGNEYTKYLYRTAYGSDTDTALSRVTVFGFNEPEGYDSEQALGFASFGDDSEYPSSYAAINPEDYSYLYLFTVSSDDADGIRDYLKNGATLSRMGSEYPLFLQNDTITQMDVMDTLDTTYGACDILFMELESDLAEDDFWDLDNPIYIEAAYFSVKVPEESSDENAIATFSLHDIAVIYMYPNGQADTTYEGHLAQLLPEMLTPLTQ